MRKRKNSKIMLGLLIAVVALGVGYAAISGVNLLINGSASIKSNGNFSVRFVRPIASEEAIDNPVQNAITISGHNADETLMNVSEMSASVIDNTHATFAVGALDEVGEYVDFIYTVVNESDEGIDAALSLEVADENDLADYFEITKSVGKNKIAPDETTTVTIRVKLIGQPKISDANGTFKVTLTATPVDESSESGSGTGGSESQANGPTLVAAQAGETHKGIVYLDPTNLSKTCTAIDAASNVNANGTPTEVKTGCMKWYIYDDFGDNYTMILDHNTTAELMWNSSNKNVAYESTNLKTLVDDLVDSSGWKVSPRLITMNEINKITGKTEFDASTTKSNYHFETNVTFSDSVRSKYDWLYNNMYKCKSDSADYGCTIEDNNKYTPYGTSNNDIIGGYWVNTTLGTAGSGSGVWVVCKFGGVLGSNSWNQTYGIRPVITLSKSEFSS